MGSVLDPPAAIQVILNNGDEFWFLVGAGLDNKFGTRAESGVARRNRPSPLQTPSPLRGSGISWTIGTAEKWARSH